MSSVSGEQNPFRPMRKTVAVSVNPRPAGGTLRRSFECSVPNLIADVQLEGRLFHPFEIADAEAALLHLKHTGKFGGSLEGVLLRTEAVSSSKIEGIRSGARNLARAAAGAESDATTEEVANNLTAVLNAVKNPPRFSLDWICDIHSQIMPNESFAGKPRTDHIFVGRGDIATADYVAPPADMVPGLLEDLLGFLQRDDIDPITKIAVGHSQFECIHPFADGNGRTGRVISLSLLTHSGFPPVPMSAGMLAETERYYKSFRDYAQGDPALSVRMHASAITAAAVTLTEIWMRQTDIASNWNDKLHTGRIGRHQAAALRWIADNPAFTVAGLAEAIGSTHRTAERIVQNLKSQEIATQSPAKMSRDSDKTGRSKQIWEIPEILDLSEEVEATTKRQMLNQQQRL